MANTRSLIGDSARDVQSCWKALAVTDVTYKVIALVVLTPLVGLLFRVLVAMLGRDVVTDQDILYTFLGPIGWLCLVALGALWIGIVAVEQAALLRILAAGRRRTTLLDALRFAAAKAWPVIEVTARMVAIVLLVIAPLLAVAAVVYYTLLTEYDINYYLREKPPVWWAALAIGAVVVATLAAVLLRLATSWLFALPLVLFEDISPRQALRASRDRASGHRRALVLWIAGWAVATLVLSALATAVVAALGRLIVPGATASLTLLEIAVGTTVLLWAAVNLAVNLLSTVSFAAILFTLYRQLGGGQQVEPALLDVATATGRGPRFGMTHARLALAGVVGIVAAMAIGGYAMHSVRLPDDTQVMAHRGSSRAAPENTLAAVKQAIADGADWVEIDVQETADGAVVVCHDSDLMRLAGKDLKIWDATLAQLQDVDIGSWFGPQFAGERVPTLGEVLDACQGRIGVNIELKYYGHDDQLEQRVADAVESRGMGAQITTMSLKIDMVKKMKAIRPDWRAGLLLSVSASNPARIDADFLAVNAKFANRHLIQSAHRSGKKVYVWTVDDALTMSTMIGRGVDCIITNNPVLARRVIDERAAMSVPERLLVELAGMLGTTPEIGEQ